MSMIGEVRSSAMYESNGLSFGLLPNSSFSNELPGLQLAWDSTSAGTAKTCWRKYLFSIVWGWAPRDQSVHLTFGLMYHAALEAYDRARAEGKDHRTAQVIAVRLALHQSWNYKLKKPWFSDHKTKNRLTLIRTVVWYLEQFEHDVLQTVILSNGKPAVELSFRFPTDFRAPTGERFLISGHLDRVAKWDQDYWIVDRKTTSWSIETNDYFQQYSPDNQMSTYDFAGQVIYQFPVKGVLIDAAQILVTFSRFERGFAPRTAAQRTEWYNEMGELMKEAAWRVEERNFPMNDKACHSYGGCPFRPICQKSPEVRAQWLKASYVRRVWDPLQIRGDI